MWPPNYQTHPPTASPLIPGTRSRASRARSRSPSRTVDLTLSQYRVLAILGDGCAASSKLAEKLAVSRPSVTGVVDGLVARGLVRRDHTSDDRRRIDVGLTDAGRLLLAAADEAVEQRMERINQLLGEIPR